MTTTIDIKDFQSLGAVNDNDNLLLAQLNGQNGKITISLLKSLISAGIKVEIKENIWYIGGVSTGINASGRQVVIRRTTTYIEWKYDDEEANAWRPLIAINDIQLHFNDLTPEQVKLIKPTLADFTPAEVAELQKPAADMVETAQQAATNADNKAKLADEAAKGANAAKTAADTAATNANEKANLANTAAQVAKEKAQEANAAAINANNKANEISNSAINADNKAKLANDAATAAVAAKEAADTAATNANNKATLAENKAKLADDAATAAIAAKEAAETATTNANNKATLAGTSAENANEKALLANNAAMRVEKAIGDCEIVKQDTIKVKQDTILAKEATITATNNANNATSSANSAATEATKKATLAGTAAANADNKATLANEKAVLANTAAQKATEETDKAIAWNTHPPKIEQGVWWVYDITNSVFVNTGFIAVGKSPYISDKLTWVVWDEAAKAFKDTGISVSSQYILTKEAIEAQLTGNITTHTHNYDAAGAAAKSLVDAKNYSDNKFVAKITGKQLSTEDFTTLLKEKLVGIDLAPLQSKITELTNSLNTLIGSGDTTSVIDTFNEIEKFLAGVTNTKSLTQMLSDLQSTIEAKIPITLPASDVYSWAKQPTKPSYTASEVGALESGGTAANSTKLAGLTLSQVQASVKPTVQDMTATTATLQPNILYKWGSVASLTITLAAASGYAEYMFEFVSGATATTLTLPASIKGEVSIEANKTYQCSIVNNFIVIGGYKL